MDAARLYNMQISQLAENSASTGQEIPIFDPSQMEGGISELWADRNTKPYLLARALRDNDGNIVAHGPTSYLKQALRLYIFYLLIYQFLIPPFHSLPQHLHQ